MSFWRERTVTGECGADELAGYFMLANPDGACLRRKKTTRSSRPAKRYIGGWRFNGDCRFWKILPDRKPDVASA